MQRLRATRILWLGGNGMLTLPARLHFSRGLSKLPVAV
jgi:hypothetical protein